MVTYWTKKYTNIAILFTICVVGIHVIFFPQYLMSLPVLFVGLGVVLFYFISMQGYFIQWKQCSNIKTKLFIHSFFYRMLGVAGMYLLTMLYDPASLPFDISAIDSKNYHKSGILAADAFIEGRSVFKALSFFWKSEGDFGFPIVIGFLYSIFGKYPLVVKIFNALLASFMVIRVYQITKTAYGERQARIAGIIAMLMPPFLWFTGVVLKETILMFLLINTSYYVLKIVNTPKLRMMHIALVMCHFGVLFYFRTILPPIIIGATMLQVVFFKFKKGIHRMSSLIIVITLLISSIYVMKLLSMYSLVEDVLEESSDRFGSELDNASKDRGISYSVALVAPLLMAGAIITPFPSLLDFEGRQLKIYSHYQNEIIRNVMYFFVFLGLIRAVRYRYKKTIFIASFAIFYIMVLAASGISFQDRFQVLALPFLIVFMADGVAAEYPKKQKHWKMYLMFIFTAIIMWNLFKLSNRGLL